MTIVFGKMCKNPFYESRPSKHTIYDSAPKTPTFFVFMDSVTNMSHIPLLIRFSLLMVEYGV